MIYHVNKETFLSSLHPVSLFTAFSVCFSPLSALEYQGLLRSSFLVDVKELTGHSVSIDRLRLLAHKTFSPRYSGTVRISYEEQLLGEPTLSFDHAYLSVEDESYLHLKLGTYDHIHLKNDNVDDLNTDLFAEHTLQDLKLNLAGMSISGAVEGFGYQCGLGTLQPEISLALGARFSYTSTPQDGLHWAMSAGYLHDKKHVKRFSWDYDLTDNDFNTDKIRQFFEQPYKLSVLSTSLAFTQNKYALSMSYDIGRYGLIENTTAMRSSVVFFNSDTGKQYSLEDQGLEGAAYEGKIEDIEVAIASYAGGSPWTQQGKAKQFSVHAGYLLKGESYSLCEGFLGKPNFSDNAFEIGFTYSYRLLEGASIALYQNRDSDGDNSLHRSHSLSLEALYYVNENISLLGEIAKSHSKNSTLLTYDNRTSLGIRAQASF